MARISVWAPNARIIELETQGERHPMHKDDKGWWTIDADFVNHGTRYAFRVDGEGPFPDPRSPYQPEGVHGPSQWTDHDSFEWTDGEVKRPTLGAAVIYELHPGTFTPEGAYDAAIERLDHLIDLGISHVELMPAAEFPGLRGWGYDGVDLNAPHHAYGGPDALKRLVNACRRRGLAVILDVVYNHLGPDGNYLRMFGPYFTGRYSTPWGEAVNLDGPESDQVRRFFIDNALMWFRDYHMDGLRIDAVHAIFDTSAVHFLEQLAAETRKLEAELDRPLLLIAESDLNDPRIIRSPEAGGYGIHAQWNEDFHHALHAVLTGEQDGYYQDFGQLEDLASVLTRGFVYDGKYSKYRRRFHGRSAVDLPAHRFICCLQNHDQIGNRAAGDRISRSISQGLLKIGAAVVLTSPFIPMLFQGEEWAASTPFLYFTDHQDPDLAEAVRKGRREEFAGFDWEPHQIPDPQSEQTFRKSKLNWNELSKSPHNEMFQWHRSLIRLRRNTPDLLNDDLNNARVDFDEKRRWMIIKRNHAITACNFSHADQIIPCEELKNKKIALVSHEKCRMTDHGIFLPAESAAIFVAKRGI